MADRKDRPRAAAMFPGRFRPRPRLLWIFFAAPAAAADSPLDLSFYHTTDALLEAFTRLADPSRCGLRLAVDNLRDAEDPGLTLRVATFSAMSYEDADDQRRPHVLLNFGAHGRELIAPEVALRLAAMLCGTANDFWDGVVTSLCYLLEATSTALILASMLIHGPYLVELTTAGSRTVDDPDDPAHPELTHRVATCLVLASYSVQILTCSAYVPLALTVYDKFVVPVVAKVRGSDAGSPAEIAWTVFITMVTTPLIIAAQCLSVVNTQYAVDMVDTFAGSVSEVAPPRSNPGRTQARIYLCHPRCFLPHCSASVRCFCRVWARREG